MIVRLAKLDDSREIALLADSIRLKEDCSEDKGFLVYILDDNSYKERILHSDYFYVAELKNKIVGFLMCYDDKTLAELKNKHLLDHEDETINFILSQNKPFVFGDQIGVLSSYANQGVGTSMTKQLFEDMKKRNIMRLYVAVLHKLFKNIVSLNFCKKLGFKFIREVENHDNKIWGIYLLNLN
jgi:ribosomal protein S18 acetylase RimI-like enzyme